MSASLGGSSHGLGNYWILVVEQDHKHHHVSVHDAQFKNQARLSRTNIIDLTLNSDCTIAFLKLLQLQQRTMALADNILKFRTRVSLLKQWQLHVSSILHRKK